MTEAVPPVDLDVLLAEAGFVRGLARSLLRDEAQVDDVTQGAFLAALERPPRIRGSARAWLGGVVRKLAARTWRDESARGRRERAAASPGTVPSAAEVLAREEVRRKVIAAVLSLDEPHRAVVLLRYYEDRPPREIAERLGVPVETVRTRLKRALQQVRGRLDREHHGDRRAWLGSLIPLAGLGGVGGPSLAVGGAVVGIKTTVGVCVGVVVLLVGALFAIGVLGPCATEPEVGEEAARAPSPVEPGTPDSPPPAAIEHVVAGVVVDQDGEPVAGAVVCVLAPENPFAEPAEIQVEEEHGRMFRTDEAGTFRVRLPGPRRVHVIGRWSPMFQPDGAGAVVDTPAEEIRIDGTRYPTGVLRIRVRDLSTPGARPVERFTCAVVSQANGSMQPQTSSGLLEMAVRLPVDVGESIVSITLVRPERSPPPWREVALRAGQTLEVNLAFASADWILGRVEDAAGNPVVGAIVFFGTQIRARGDEPFKPFVESRLPDAVRTDGDGWFELRGDGREVTVWHQDLSPVTVAIHDAHHVSLPPRGSIRGRLLDANEAPAAGVEVTLDRTRKARTDADGRFEFEGVEAGVRGLALPDRRYVGVRVQPGEAVEATAGAGIETVRVLFRTGGEPWQPATRGMGFLTGFGPVFTVYGERFAADADAFEAKGMLPGTYLFLGSGGLVARVEIGGPEAVADLGTADLTVTGAPGTRVYVVPEAAADEFGQLMAGRVGSKAIPESGEVLFSPLPVGRYAVGIDREGLRVRVEVKGIGARASLR